VLGFVLTPMTVFVEGREAKNDSLPVLDITQDTAAKKNVF